MKRASIYLRVSTQEQTTSNQEHELRQAAERADWQVAKVYKDHGISGAKGRNGRPALHINLHYGRAFCAKCRLFVQAI